MHGKAPTQQRIILPKTSMVPNLRNCNRPKNNFARDAWEMSLKFSEFPWRELYSKHVLSYWKKHNVPVGRNVVCFYSLEKVLAFMFCLLFLFMNTCSRSPSCGDKNELMWALHFFFLLCLPTTLDIRLPRDSILIINDNHKNENLLSSYYVSGNYLSILCLSYCSNPSTTLWNVYYNYLYFTDLGTGASGV